MVYGNGINNLEFQSILCRPENKPFVKYNEDFSSNVCLLNRPNQMRRHDDLSR